MEGVVVILPTASFKILESALPPGSLLRRRLRGSSQIAGTIRFRCSMDEAEELLKIAKKSCPQTVEDIELAIRSSRRRS